MDVWSTKFGEKNAPTDSTIRNIFENYHTVGYVAKRKTKRHEPTEKRN